MYHGGQLSEDFYVGGKVDFFDYYDKDFMSLLNVDNMVEELGYGNVFMIIEEVFDERGDKVVGDGVFMKFVDDHVDAQEDAVLASIREQNNLQFGEGSWQQKEEFEEEIDVDLIGEPDYNSDGLHSVHEDEDSGPSNNKHYPEFNEKIDMKNPYLSLGLIFRDAAQFKKAVVMHSMINGYEDVYFPRNEKFKVDATCKEGCSWLVKYGKMCNSNNIQIKKIFKITTHVVDYG
ncbi:hypothetical protein D8674_018780 [Pyrus ussuriensis x Pyrus communis]|uniref:PB1-like domain-containing protein n=1 Tax=Pyrus ussuriensis x Pyrus communis TaxID=2448454 RepID=A0A5N5G689_9ROSA|nr:hypothetical protein D8674_018780 [Pyrus ussuriensis x Pyrus communis]